MARSSSAPLKTSTRFAPALKRPLPLAKEERAIGPSLLRTLVLPDEVERWSLTTLREKMVKIGAKVYSFARNALSQNCRTREARGSAQRSYRDLPSRPGRIPLPCEAARNALS